MTYKRLIASITGIVLLVGQFGPVIAQSMPTAPTAPTAPTGAPTAPPPPTAPSEPTPPPPPPTAPILPTPTVAPTPLPQPTQTETSSPPTSDSSPQPSVSETTHEGHDSPSNSGTVGETSITTGDANAGATVATSGNTNTSSTVVPADSGGSATIANTGNGSGSTNTGSVSLTNDTQSTQFNSANVSNSMEQSATSGSNVADKNVGNTTIDTGNANVSGTIVNALNTNVDSVAVVEFNIVDNHVGDYVLDFGANCVSGCGVFDATLDNTGNGSESTNSASLTADMTNVSFQHNDATLENSMDLFADSGNNSASRTTGGDSTIYTGDANVSAHIVNFANNNLSGGEVIYAVVNIFGSLIGDIVFPEEVPGGTTLANSGNGSHSTNTANASLNQTNTTTQTNDADITNILSVDGNTGNNDVVRNTGGSNEVYTGDVNVDAQVVNVANTNIIGDMWLVLVNEAGKWIGKIMEALPGAMMAGSEGLEFEVNEHGEIAVTNSGNGSGSTNNGDLTQDTSTSLTQENTASITNTVNLGGNTGGNSASNNTGGNNLIDTGDVNIVATIVNFVNNNISGGGRLFVTVVNVFGDWLGNFRGPGVGLAANQEANPDSTYNQVIVDADSPQISQGTTTSSHEKPGSQQNTSSPGSTESEPLGAEELEREPSLVRVLGFGINQTPPAPDNPQVAEAGMATIPTLAKTVKEKLDINLAYLVLLAPPASLYFLLRRRGLGQG